MLNLPYPKYPYFFLIHCQFLLISIINVTLISTAKVITNISFKLQPAPSRTHPPCRFRKTYSHSAFYLSHLCRQCQRDNDRSPGLSPVSTIILLYTKPTFSFSSFLDLYHVGSRSFFVSYFCLNISHQIKSKINFLLNLHHILYPDILPKLILFSVICIVYIYICMYTYVYK